MSWNVSGTGIPRGSFVPFPQEVEFERLLARRLGAQAAKIREERLQFPEDRVGFLAPEDLGEEAPAVAKRLPRKAEDGADEIRGARLVGEGGSGRVGGGVRDDRVGLPPEEFEELWPAGRGRSGPVARSGSSPRAASPSEGDRRRRFSPCRPPCRGGSGSIPRARLPRRSPGPRGEPPSPSRRSGRVCTPPGNGTLPSSPAGSTRLSGRTCAPCYWNSTRLTARNPVR